MKGEEMRDMYAELEIQPPKRGRRTYWTSKEEVEGQREIYERMLKTSMEYQQKYLNPRDVPAMLKDDIVYLRQAIGYLGMVRGGFESGKVRREKPKNRQQSGRGRG